MKFYFYQKGKDSYLESEVYYPQDNEYFNIPEGETLKTLIEKNNVYMSNDIFLIKKIINYGKTTKET